MSRGNFAFPAQAVYCYMPGKCPRAPPAAAKLRFALGLCYSEWI